MTKKEIKPLGKKIVFNPDGINWVSEKNLKNSLQNLKEELEESLAKINLKTTLGRNRLPSIILVEVEGKINKAFLKHIGGELLE